MGIGIRRIFESNLHIPYYSTFNLTFAGVKLLLWEIWHENERVMSETFPTFERILGYE